MIKILIGILLLPIFGWTLTQLPFPTALPTGFHTALTSVLGWVWGLNQVIPIDTLFTLFGIILMIEFIEMILHLVMTIINIVKK